MLPALSGGAIDGLGRLAGIHPNGVLLTQ
jgi:hypothetical protein